jgi:hypothetical protein
MTLEHERLSSLIEFAKESAKLRGSPVCNVTVYPFHEYEHTLKELPGLHFNAGGDEDEVWLTVDRLHESKAPKTDQVLLGLWLKVSNDPSKEPSLKNSVEFSTLLDAGFIKPNVQSNSPDRMSLVSLQAFDQADEVTSQFKVYKTLQWMPWAAEEKKTKTEYTTLRKFIYPEAAIRGINHRFSD